MDDKRAPEPRAFAERPMTTSPSQFSEVLIAALSGGGITQLGNWLASRTRNKAYTMGAVDHAVQTAMRVVTDRLEVVEGQHKECEANLRDVRSDLDHAKSEITRLMTGPVALPGERPPT